MIIYLHTICDFTKNNKYHSFDYDVWKCFICVCYLLPICDFTQK